MFSSKIDYIISAREINSDYIDTEQVAKIFPSFIYPEKKCITIAHPDHLNRCEVNLNKLGIYSFTNRLIHTIRISFPWTLYGCNENGYDKDSTQPWTRNKKKYLLHESRIKDKTII